jgi:hypothetical protein
MQMTKDEQVSFLNELTESVLNNVDKYKKRVNIYSGIIGFLYDNCDSINTNVLHAYSDFDSAFYEAFEASKRINIDKSEPKNKNEQNEQNEQKEII